MYDADCLCLSLSLYAWVCVGDKITFAENSLSQDENYPPLPNSPASSQHQMDELGNFINDSIEEFKSMT